GGYGPRRATCLRLRTRTISSCPCSTESRTFRKLRATSVTESVFMGSLLSDDIRFHKSTALRSQPADGREERGDLSAAPDWPLPRRGACARRGGPAGTRATSGRG